MPFEEDAEYFYTEATQFYIENVASGDRLAMGEIVSGSVDDSSYKGIKSQVREIIHNDIL